MEIRTVEDLKTVINSNEPMFQKIFDAHINGFAILQFPLDFEYSFMDYNSTIKYMNRDLCRNDYKMLYAEEVPVFTGSDISILDGIFTRFNIGERPKNYYGTSVSVSNIIALKINGVVQTYYVDRFGYKELSNFVI